MLKTALLAERGPPDLFVVVLAVATVVMFLMMVLIMPVVLKRYKRCPPNRILVIYGRTGPEEGTRCIHGGAVFVFPLIQDYAWLALEPIRVEVSRQRTASGRTISDPLPRVFSVAIGTTPELMQTAAARLLGLTADEIRQHAEDVIIAQLDRLIDAIETDRVQPGTDDFYARLKSALQTELSQLGLVLINCRRE